MPRTAVFGLALFAVLVTACESTEPSTTPTADEASPMFVEAQPVNYDRPDFDALWNYNDPAGTRNEFREILSEAQAAGDWPFVSELLTQIARTEGLLREFDNAHLTLNTAEDLIEERDSVAQVRYLLERGRIFNSSNRPDKARPLFLEALEIAQGIGAEYHAIDAAHMLAIVARGRASLRWNERAIAMAETASDPRARQWLGSLYNNAGWSYHETEDYPRALERFEAALAFRETQGDPLRIRIARWCVARCLRSLERVEEALAMQQALEDELSAAGENDGFVNEEIAECLLLLDRSDEARPHFAKAYALLSQDPWFVANEPRRLERLRTLGTDG